MCSGDGSVGWVLQEVDKLDMHVSITWVLREVISLGNPTADLDPSFQMLHCDNVFQVI